MMGKLVQPHMVLGAAPGGELVLWVLPPKHMQFSGRGLSVGPLLPPRHPHLAPILHPWQPG